MNDHDEILRDYQRDGVVRISEFISVDHVREIREEIERYIRNDLHSKPLDARTLEADGHTVRNLWRLEQHCTYFREFAFRDELVSLMGKLLQGEPVLIGVETFNKPARIGSAVPYHQDNAYFCRTPPDVLTLWIAIDPVTRDNGPVSFVLGSHKAGLLPSSPSGVTGNSIGLAQPPDLSVASEYQALLEPGDATIHHCEVIHRSEPNRSNQSRLGLLFVFRAAHTQVNPDLQAAYDVARTRTPPA